MNKSNIFTVSLLMVLLSSCKPYQNDVCHGDPLPAGAHYNSGNGSYKKHFTGGTSSLNASNHHGLIDSCSFQCDSGKNYNSLTKTCDTLCSSGDATANGWDTLHSLSISGIKLGSDVSLCVVSSCGPLYSLDQVTKSCKIISSPCTLADSAANGWEVTNASSASGLRIQNDVSSCAVDACNPAYYKNSTSKLCEKSKRHLIVVAGQSNAQGQSSIPSCGSLVATNPRIQQLSRGFVQTGACTYTASAAGTWMLARDPLQFNTPNASSSFSMAFASQYLNDIKPYDTIGIIPVAVGGTSFIANNWTSSSSLFLEVKNKTNSELASNPDSQLDAILWQQGESDAVSLASAQAYESRMINFITDMRNGITGALNVPILIGQMSPELVATDSNYQIVQTAQTKMLSYFTNIAIVSSSGLIRFDSFHFDFTSTQTLGARYYSAISSLNSVLAVSEISDITISRTRINSGVSNQGMFLSRTGGTGTTYTAEIGSENFDVIGNIVYAKVPGLTAGLYPLRIKGTTTQGRTFSKDFTITVADSSNSNLSVNVTGTGKFCRQGNLLADLDSAWTISFLFKTDVVNGPLLDSTIPVTAKGIYFMLQNGRPVIQLISNYPTLIRLASYTTLTPNRWYRMTVTYNGNSLSSGLNMYLDSNLDEVVKNGNLDSTLNHTSNLCFGNRPVGGTYGLSSINFDELTFWNKVLSLTEVAELNNNQSALLHSSSLNLTRYFKVENSGVNNLVDTLGGGDLMRINSGFRYDADFTPN